MKKLTLSVESLRNGSSLAVDRSGTRAMSDSWMAWKPRIEEPSNISCSSGSKDSTGTVKCCMTPGRSQNRTSTNLTSLSEMNFFTSSAFWNDIQLLLGPAREAGLQLMGATSAVAHVEGDDRDRAFPRRDPFVSCRLTEPPGWATGRARAVRHDRVPWKRGQQGCHRIVDRGPEGGRGADGRRIRLLRQAPRPARGGPRLDRP